MVPKFQVLIFILSVSTGLGNPLVATNKLSLATWGSYHQQDHMGPGTYVFGYDIEDPVTGNIQFKQEERHPNGTITGNYGYVDAEGRPHVVTYTADENGYRAKLEVEGEPVKHFPEMPIGRGNSRHQQPTDKHDPAESSEGLPPFVYRLIYPSFYDYLSTNGVL